MRASAIDRRQSDSPVRFSLAWAGAVSFLLFLTRDPPDPGLFLPVAFAALPFAAAPRQRVAFRVIAAALLAGFVAMRGMEPGSLVFLPAVAGLLLSAYGMRGHRTSAGRRRVRCSRRF